MEGNQARVPAQFGQGNRPVAAESQLNFQAGEDELDELKSDLQVMFEKILEGCEGSKSNSDQVSTLAMLAHDLEEAHAKLKMLIRYLKIKQAFPDTGTVNKKQTMEESPDALKRHEAAMCRT